MEKGKWTVGAECKWACTKRSRLGCWLSRAWIEALGGLTKTKPELIKLLVACLDFFFCLLTSLSQILYLGP
jgi:hypothetical protein